MGLRIVCVSTELVSEIFKRSGRAYTSNVPQDAVVVTTLPATRLTPVDAIHFVLSSAEWEGPQEGFEVPTFDAEFTAIQEEGEAQ